VVVPCYNEADSLPAFLDRAIPAMEAIDPSWELIAVNDGSRDGTLLVLQEAAGLEPRMKVLDLSRNFGKEAAVTAGLDHSSGQAVVIIDADLQEPPELIAAFVEKWREGYEVVYGKRTDRKSDPWHKRLTSSWFHTLMRKVAHIDIPSDTGDFRLMSREVVDAVTSLREQHRYMKGLFSWVGFKTTSVPFTREARQAGTTKWSYGKLWHLALEGFTSLSFLPLQAATYLGLLALVAAGGYIVYLAIATWQSDFAATTVHWLVALLLFVSGVQLLVLGVIGEYLGRVLGESKRRPLYFVRKRVGWDEASQ
jgi:glycosyltransferase involved in cell wall biosynthesis